MEVYFGWVGLSEHFLCVGEVSGGIFWLGGGGWTFFLGG